MTVTVAQKQLAVPAEPPPLQGNGVPSFRAGPLWTTLYRLRASALFITFLSAPVLLQTTYLGQCLVKFCRTRLTYEVVVQTN